MITFRLPTVLSLFCALLLVTRVSSATVAEPTPLQIEDLYRHDAVTELTALPGGKAAVYVRDWAERGQLFRRQALWLVEGSPDQRRPLEPGEPDARRPLVSPDGRWLAFLSSRPLPDGQPPATPLPIWSETSGDIWLFRLDERGRPAGAPLPLGGRSKPYGHVFTDSFYGRIAFSPDSQRLVLVADDGRDLRSAEEQARHITVVREDQGEGYEGYGPAAVWVADLNAAATDVAAHRIRRVTPDDAWYGDPQWTPDGRQLVVHANRTADRESVRFSINKNYDLWRVDIESGQLEQLTEGPGPQVSPRISPDGRRVACLSVPRRGPHADVYNLELVELAHPKQGRVLFDHHADANGPPPHQLPSYPLPGDCWLDNRWFLVDTQAGMQSERQLIDADSPRGERDPAGPGSRASYQSRNAGTHGLAPPSNTYLRERLRATDEVVRWRSFDGWEIDGVLTLPPAGVAQRPYKMVLYPHGGPHSRAGVGFNFTVQLFAAHGYAVFQPNFRGTSGYGRKFLDADRFDLGGGDRQDILTGIDHLVREGIVDRDRQFVYGVSYGGYMTTWLIGHTHQFRAAAPQNAVTDMNVMWGVGDLQSWTQWELGGLPWEVPDRMRQLSPFTHVHRVKTPTLILHADHDRRCPLPMGLMFYRGLQAAGVESQMVIYHNERHGIAQLPHLEDIYRRVLDWFARHDAR